MQIKDHYNELVIKMKVKNEIFLKVVSSLFLELVFFYKKVIRVVIKTKMNNVTFNSKKEKEKKNEITIFVLRLTFFSL